jgi:hypothetical protein
MEMGLVFVVCGDYQVALWLHTTQDPPTDQWDAACVRIAELKKKQAGDISNVRVLVITDGGAPNASQRGQLFTDLLEGRAKSAVVTTVLSNRLKRGVATAIFWLNPNFKAFSPDQFAAALTHLDLVGHGPALIAALQQLQRSVSTTQTLGLLTV